MRQRLAALLVLLTAACTQGSGAPETAVERRLARAGLDQQLALTAVCDNWRLDDPDAITVNQYLHDLLLEHRFTPGQPPAVTEDQIDAVVDQACRDHRDNPGRFLTAVTDELGLTDTQLDQRITEACRRYADHAPRPEDDLSRLVRDIAATHGVALPVLRAAIAAVCAPA